MLIARRDGLRIGGVSFSRGDTLPAVSARVQESLIRSGQAQYRPDPAGWDKGPVVFDPPPPRTR